VESKLTYRDPSEEFKFGGESMGDFASPTSLLRNPVVLGVIMMVVFWQTNKFWGKGGGGGSGGGGGGRGGDADFNPADMFKQLEAHQRRSGGGGGGGRDFGFGRDFGGGGGGSRIEDITG